MVKILNRKIFQALTSILYNLNIGGFLSGKIYQGEFKRICVPGLNCYSCPGAIGSCPIGSLQSALLYYDYYLPFYIVGMLLMFGALLGRFICGYLCPFGFFQELLYKIKSPKISHSLFPKKLKYSKYFILVLFVFILPIFYFFTKGYIVPAFCKFICPAGTLEAGIPLTILNEDLRKNLGFVFSWKMFLLGLTIFVSVVIYRPFCAFVCPLGAIYSVFNKIAIFRYAIDEKACDKCGVCQKSCNLNIETYVEPNSSECIRCGECIRNCPNNALKYEISAKSNKISITD